MAKGRKESEFYRFDLVALFNDTSASSVLFKSFLLKDRSDTIKPIFCGAFEAGKWTYKDINKTLIMSVIVDSIE